MAVQQPARGQEVLAASGERQRHDKRQRTKEVQQKVVVQQDTDATTNQRTRGEYQEAGTVRGKGTGNWRWLRNERQYKREMLLLHQEMSKMESRQGEAMDRARAERKGEVSAAKSELIN